MEGSDAAHGNNKKNHRIVVALTILVLGQLPFFTAIAETDTPGSKESPLATTSPTAPTIRGAVKILEDLRAGQRAFQPTEEGCYSSSPGEGWQKSKCISAPRRPYPAARGVRPTIVGNGNDASATTSAPIYSAVGSFDSVNDVTSETGMVGNTGPSVANAFSLQLNSQTFQTPLCKGRPLGCVGWQQFVYSNDCGNNIGCTFIQYWLIGYGTPCPKNWLTFGGTPAGAPGCYLNSDAVVVPRQTIHQLSTMALNGNAATHRDTVIFYLSNTLYLAAAPASNLNLAQNWSSAEFNVFGDGGGGQANFNSQSTIVVRTSVSSGSVSAPTCNGNGFTAETNNLNLVPATGTPPGPGKLPAIVFTESGNGSVVSPCAAASTVGANFNGEHVVYTYCIGDEINKVGSRCTGIQKPFDCTYRSQDWWLGEGVCRSEKYTFFKTMRTGDPLGGHGCGYSYGLMFCTNADSSDRLCGPSDDRYGCAAGPVKYP
jgi:hypothetical protein